jgi:hypothetical protein
MNIMEEDRLFASLKRSLTLLAPRATYICSKSLPLHAKKGTTTFPNYGPKLSTNQRLVNRIFLNTVFPMCVLLH